MKGAVLYSANIRLILSLSKDEASHGGGAASPFDKLRMRPNEASGSVGGTMAIDA